MYDEITPGGKTVRLTEEGNELIQKNMPEIEKQIIDIVTEEMSLVRMVKWVNLQKMLGELIKEARMYTVPVEEECELPRSDGRG